MNADELTEKKMALQRLAELCRAEVSQQMAAVYLAAVDGFAARDVAAEVGRRMMEPARQPMPSPGELRASIRAAACRERRRAEGRRGFFAVAIARRRAGALAECVDRGVLTDGEARAKAAEWGLPQTLAIEEAKQ